MHLEEESEGANHGQARECLGDAEPLSVRTGAERTVFIFNSWLTFGSCEYADRKYQPHLISLHLTGGKDERIDAL